MPKSLRRDVQKLDSSLSVTKKKKKGGRYNKKALRRIQDWWVKGSEEDKTLPPGAGRAMVSTTQAVDIINGGVKVNALVSLSLLQSCHPLINSPR
jgi:Gly-Xaa carboxypeptidase